MNERNDERLRELLREAIGPVAVSELKRDLWPQMLRKLNGQTIRVPWYDWALAAILAASLCVSPGSILALVYHL